MDILLYVGLLLSLPVFYILGLVTFIRFLARTSNAHPVTPQVQSEVAPTPSTEATPEFNAEALKKLREYAAKQPKDSARELRAIIAELAPHHPPTVAQSAPLIGPNAVPASGWSGMAPASDSAKPGWSSADVGDVMKSLDNINVLLYLGAFLVVVSAGIFVGYNFETLSGWFKTIFLGVFAALFYGIGLVLYMRLPKLRPAGVTFTGIGLILLPLVGAAAYNFTSLHDHGAATWFATSVFTLAAYAATLRLTRQTYVAYLMAFTCLSLFESSIALIDLPLYWFGWGMGLMSIVLFTLGRLKFFWEDAVTALTLSANVFIPASVLFSFFAAPDSGLAQIGVTIGIAGVFYAAMARRFSLAPQGEAYWAFALAALPACLGIGLWETFSRTGVAAMVFGVYLLYVAAEYTLWEYLTAKWRQLLAGITALLPLAGVVVLWDHPAAVSAALVGTAIVNAYLAHRQRLTGIGLIAILSALAAPFVGVLGYIKPEHDWLMIAFILLVEVPALVWWARRMAGWPESGTEVGIAGYLGALGLALGAAMLESSGALLGVGLVVAIAAAYLSRTESRPAYLYVAGGSLYLGLAQIVPLADWSWSVASLIVLAAGVALYTIGTQISDTDRSNALRYVGVAGPVIGAIIGIGLGEKHLEPVLALAVASLLLMAEAHRQSESTLHEVGAGGLVLSFNWLMAVVGSSETQLYTVPWAAYVAYLGYRHRDQGRSTIDGIAALALGILTIPLALQALASDGQGYGLLLILEALARVFAGMGLRYKLVTIWGVTVLVLEVLYQMRDVFYALPKYLISAGLGIALLAVAIVMLQRRDQGRH